MLDTNGLNERLGINKQVFFNKWGVLGDLTRGLSTFTNWMLQTCLRHGCKVTQKGTFLAIFHFVVSVQIRPSRNISSQGVHYTTQIVTVIPVSLNKEAKQGNILV